MKIHLAHTSPNGDSTQSFGVSGPHKGREAHVSHQSLDPLGTLAVDFEGETKLDFEISGIIEVVQLRSAGICVRPSAGGIGKGKGKIVVKKTDCPILVIEVTVGGNTTVGLVVGSFNLDDFNTSGFALDSLDLSDITPNSLG